MAIPTTTTIARITTTIRATTKQHDIVEDIISKQNKPTGSQPGEWQSRTMWTRNPRGCLIRKLSFSGANKNKT